MLAHLALGVTSVSTLAAAARAWQLNRQLHTDPLTGLGNRAALRSAFRRSPKHGLVAVAVGDMNGFKALNDTHGHRFGDRVLIETAHALRRTVRRGEVPVRLHGDEFAVLLTNVSSARTAENRVRDLQTAIASITCVDGQPVEVAMALGVMTSPAETAELGALLGSADDRMYGDKHTNHCSDVLISQAQ